jgi:hypothetical protein
LRIENTRFLEGAAVLNKNKYESGEKEKPALPTGTSVLLGQKSTQHYYLSLKSVWDGSKPPLFSSKKIVIGEGVLVSLQ